MSSVRKFVKFAKEHSETQWIIGDLLKDVPLDFFKEVAKVFKEINNCLYPESFKKYVIPEKTVQKGNHERSNDVPSDRA